MTQTPKTIIMVFGAALFITLLGIFLWSLSQPPVTEGPMPPMPVNHQPMSN